MQEHFTVLAGFFAEGDADITDKEVHLRMHKGMAPRSIPLRSVTSVEMATEENVRHLGAAAGWATAGAVLLGPVGLLAGAVLGGRGKDVTFIVTIDGRRILAKGSPKVYEAFLKASFR